MPDLVTSMLRLAARYAAKSHDRRHHRVGAVGIRRDGALVHACNGPTEKPNPRVHAEARLARKLTPGSTVFVTRIARDGSWAMARPCRRCQGALRARGAIGSYYSVGPREWGWLPL